MEIRKAYSFDDVLLVPKYSTMLSRGEANTRTYVAEKMLDLPLISSPMDTVTEENMALFMYEKGGLGIIHRYCTVNEQYGMVKWVKSMGASVGAAVGINGDSDERVEALVEAGVDMLVIDIAHGHMQQALDKTVKIKESYGNKIKVMSGNIVTPEAAGDYFTSGADVLRVGVGPGSACTTRQVAGVGYPQLSAIAEIADLYGANVSIVADGGIRHSGDVVKALAVGADAVMVGGLLSPFSIAAGKQVTVQTDEVSPINDVFPAFQHPKGMDARLAFGKAQEQHDIPRYVTMKEFRGMASDAALSQRGSKDHLVEGDSFLVPVRYDHEDFIAQFRDGIQAGFAYLGARNLSELRKRAQFVEVSTFGLIEGTPHFKQKEVKN